MSPTPLRLVSFTEAAEQCNVTSEAVRYWVKRGFVTGYRVAGSHRTYVDLDEVAAHNVERISHRDFGPDARIVTLAEAPAAASAEVTR